MRNSFLAPLKFLMYFVISTLVFCFFTMIYYWGQSFSGAEGSRILLFFLPISAKAQVFPAVSAALLFTAFDYRHKKMGMTGAVMLTAAVLAVLLSGFMITSRLQQNNPSKVFQPLKPGRIHSLTDGYLYIEAEDSAETGVLTNIVVRRKQAQLPGFNYYSDGRLSGTDPQILNSDVETAAVIDPPNPIFDHIFKPPGLLGQYLADIAFCNSLFISAAESGGPYFLLLTAAATFFLVVCLLFKGTSAWPLFEMVLILGLHRIVFFVLRVIVTEDNFISETFFGGTRIESLPLLVLTALSALLLLAGILIRTSQKIRNSI